MNNTAPVTWPEVIGRLTAHGRGDVSAQDMAAACYQLERQLGIEIDFVHTGLESGALVRGRRYKAVLVLQVAPPMPDGEDLKPEPPQARPDTGNENPSGIAVDHLVDVDVARVPQWRAAGPGHE